MIKEEDKRTWRELWEIDYDTEQAANVSEYAQLDLLKHVKNLIATIATYC